MSYRTQQNVTMLSELPDIEDLEDKQSNLTSAGLSMIPPADMGKYQKYIRNNTYNPQQLSGMSPPPSYLPNDPYKIGYHSNQGSYMDNIPMPGYHQQNQQALYTHGSSGGLLPNNQQYYEPYEKPGTNCVDIANHAANCPVCSKLYNNDNTVYIIAIAILTIICILLLKRVLDI
jgi:hypothetical protein